MRFTCEEDVGALLLGTYGQFELYARLDPEGRGTCDVYARRDNDGAVASIYIFEHHAESAVLSPHLQGEYPELWRIAMREAMQRLRRILGWYVIDYAQLGLSEETTA